MVDAVPLEERRTRPRLDARGIVGGTIVGLVLLTAVFAPAVAPHDPLEQDLLLTLLPPSFAAGGDPAHFFGTDSLGRDILSRLIYAAEIAAIVALVAASLACLIGSLLGLLAGFYRGVVDQLVSRLIDVWMSFPPVLLSIVLAAAVGAGLPAVILAIVVIDWTRFARVVRSEVQVNLELDYVAAARVVGLAPRRILMAEILPNVLPVLATLLTVEMGIAVIVEAILSFVGLSVSSDTPTWGGMIAEGRQVIHQAPFLVALPIGCIVITVLGFNLLGDGLRASLDPVQRR
jgi:ABC-type dipeptide/oligopeptide/nickel transport system permease subunit